MTSTPTPASASASAASSPVGPPPTTSTSVFFGPNIEDSLPSPDRPVELSRLGCAGGGENLRSIAGQPRGPRSLDPGERATVRSLAGGVAPDDDEEKGGPDRRVARIEAGGRPGSETAGGSGPGERPRTGAIRPVDRVIARVAGRTEVHHERRTGPLAHRHRARQGGRRIARLDRVEIRVGIDRAAAEQGGPDVNGPVVVAEPWTGRGDLVAAVLRAERNRPADRPVGRGVGAHEPRFAEIRLASGDD